MKTGTYIEELPPQEKIAKEWMLKREEIVDAMWIVMVLDDGHEIRFQHMGDHISISTSTGVLNIRPDSSNTIKIGVPPLGSPAKGTSDKT